MIGMSVVLMRRILVCRNDYYSNEETLGELVDGFSMGVGHQKKLSCG